ncbi:MAG: hypothetical protein JXR91_12775 [Deltaproteobacteria bacterium]|nr:hypothetical protein [Deltaproteobacteria bacterium]
MGKILKYQKNNLPFERSVPLEYVNRDMQNAIELSLFKESIIKESKLSLIDLSILMAQKIISKELHLSNEEKEKIYRKQLKDLSYFAPGTFFISSLIEISDETKKLAEELNFSIIEDTSLKTGDCIIEAAGIKIDGTIDTALYHLKKALLA